MFCLAVWTPFPVLGLETLAMWLVGGNLRAHLICYPILPGITNLHCLMCNVSEAAVLDIVSEFSITWSGRMNPVSVLSSWFVLEVSKERQFLQVYLTL